jgi:cobalt/nickel transport system permease protein
MKHSFLDLYREGHSPVHQLDPRIKLVLTFAFILAASLVPAGFWPGYLVLLLLALGVVALAAVPLSVALGRSLVAIPFALLAAASLPFVRPGPVLLSWALGPWQVTLTRSGLQALGEVLARSWLSILMAGLLSATTPFPDLLAALQGMGVPKPLVAVMSFLYRYLFVLVDEAQRLERARAARSAQWNTRPCLQRRPGSALPGRAAQTSTSVGTSTCVDARPQAPEARLQSAYKGLQTRSGSGGTIAWRAHVLGGMIGSLFVRSYERSERIYQAMLARLFAGEVRTLARRPPRITEIGAGVVVFLLLTGIVVAGYWLG